MTYYPHPALCPIRDYAPSIRGIKAAERAICRKAIRALHAAGYTLRVDAGEGWETPRVAPGEGCDTLMRALFNLDEAWLCVFAPLANKHFAWVRFVFGNDGWDVISDYTTNIEATLAPVNEYARSHEGK